MKKSITGVVALLAGAFVAHSQGTVSFGNYANLSTYIYVSLGSKNLGGPAASTGIAANDTGDGNDWTVALYGNSGASDAASTLVQLDTAGGTAVTASLANGVSDPTAGTWLSTAVGDVPGTTGGGQAATVQVYAWYNDGGTITSYAAAQAANVPTGFSATGNISTGGPLTGAPPAFPASLPVGTGANQIGNFSVSATVPEPSTIALGVMGASAFLLRLRKKK